MFSRRHLLGTLTAAVTLPLLPARAAEWIAFSKDKMTAAVAAGGPVLVVVHATWCPTCKAQEPILGGLTAQPKFAALTAFSIDFDSEKPVLRELGVQRQSTLIVFKAGAEVGRSVGDTQEASIAALLDRAL